MKRKITFALTLMGLSSLAIAGAPGNNMVIPTGIPVIAPDSTGIWSIGIEALYMESNTQFQYAGINEGINDHGELEFQNESVTNDWNWGGEIDISYLFPGSSRDVSASYTYLNQDGSNSIHSPVGTINAISTTQTPALLTAALESNEAEASVDQTLNTATLTMGQLVTVGDRISLHPFGGLQFADIDTTNKVSYETESEATEAEITNGTYKGNSDFDGVGLRAGLDAGVTLGNHLKVIGSFAGALLVGNMDSAFQVRNAAFPYNDENDSYTAIVPELDAKLGLDYEQAFTSNTSMNIQIGYEVVNYFNAENNDFLDADYVNSTNSSSNFSYNGPYLRLQLNVA